MMNEIHTHLNKDNLCIFPTEHLQYLLLCYGQNRTTHFNEVISSMVYNQLSGENVMRVIALTGKVVIVGDNCMITMYHTVDHYKLECS